MTKRKKSSTKFARPRETTRGKAGVRVFDSGATRDTDTGKLDYEGFLSPVVVLRYGEYMHKHRIQSDGSLRDSDNWQSGFGLSVCIKSAWRHFLDWWLHHRGKGDLAREPLEEALCAVIFNASAYLNEILSHKNDKKSK